MVVGLTDREFFFAFFGRIQSSQGLPEAADALLGKDGTARIASGSGVDLRTQMAKVEGTWNRN